MQPLPQVDQLADLQEAEIELPDMTEMPPRPEFPERVRRGLLGRYLEKLEPHTEADPAAIVAQFLVMFGNVVGRKPHFRVEADQHYLNLFVVLVGQSSKGRKGVSASQAKRLFLETDREWCERRFDSGLSSGEGLIWAVRDPIEKQEPIKDRGRLTGETQSVVEDPGETDKRLVVVESEFASVLKRMKGESNTLSAVLRNAWDGKVLSTLVKTSKARATGAHISVIGHITRDELVRYLDTTETANGFGNRFLWASVDRSKLLPEGGAAHRVDFGPEIQELRACIDFASTVDEIKRSDEARELWAGEYARLSQGHPGLFGAMTGRAEAQTMRLACLFALLDRSDVVELDHLKAALALWRYFEASTRQIFGDALGDQAADTILRALQANPGGLTRTQIADLFQRHKGSKELGKALGVLRSSGLAVPQKEQTGGRPTEVWQLITLAK